MYLPTYNCNKLPEDGRLQPKQVAILSKSKGYTVVPNEYVYKNNE